MTYKLFSQINKSPSIQYISIQSLVAGLKTNAKIFEDGWSDFTHIIVNYNQLSLEPTSSYELKGQPFQIYLNHALQQWIEAS